MKLIRRWLRINGFDFSHGAWGDGNYHTYNVDNKR